MVYSPWKVSGYLLGVLTLLATLSWLLTLYIAETADYRHSELRTAKCKRDKESQEIFSEECRAAMEHINHYPLLRAVERLGRGVLNAVRHAIVDVFDTWTFMFLLLLVFMSFIFWSAMLFQRTRERWQYEKHFGKARALPSSLVHSNPFVIELPKHSPIDARASVYNRKKRIEERVDNDDDDANIDYNKLHEEEQKDKITELGEDDGVN